MQGLRRMVIFGLVTLLAACSSPIPTSPDRESVPLTSTTSDGTIRALSACTISSIASGTWYSQTNPSWSGTLLGNHVSDTIGGQGCVITTLAMVYHNRWGVSTTPTQMNTSAKSSGCFGPGSSLVDVNCAINSRGGPHAVSDITMSNVATQICAGTPVMVDVSGGAHKMLVYSYNGGSTTAMSSYTVIDPLGGASKSLSSYTASRWRKLQ